MDAQLPITGVIVVPYQACYPAPICAAAGAVVVPAHEDPDNPGWVPTCWLLRDGQQATLTRAYNAIELSVEVGELVLLHDEVSGWGWISNQAGRFGWVPRSHIRLGPG